MPKKFKKRSNFFYFANAFSFSHTRTIASVSR